MNIKQSKVLATSTAVLLLSLFASGSALAQGMYLYGAIGGTSANLKKSDIDSDLVSAGVTGLASSVDESDVGYKLQLGYMINRNFGVEGGWVDLGKFTYNASFIGGSANGDIKASGFNIAGIGVLPLDNNFSLFGKLGTINAKVKASVSATGPGGAASGSASDTEWSPNYGLGVMYNLSPKMAIRAEWERFDKLGDKNKTGEGDVDLWSVGLRFSF